MPKKTFTRRIDTSLIDAIKSKADDRGTSDTRIVEEALEKDLKASGHLKKNLYFGRKPDQG